MSEQEDDVEQQLDRKNEDMKNDDGPLFPILAKESLREYMIPLASAALLGITAIHVLSSAQGQDPLAEGTKHKAMHKFLISMPYSVFPAGLAGLGAAMGATKRTRVLGFAAGFLLAELVFLVMMGGVVTFVRSDVDLRIVIPVTVAILIALVYIWLLMCAFPKCLTLLWCCCRDRFTMGGRQNICKVCGAVTVNGRNLSAGAAGAVPCPACAVAPRDAASKGTPAASKGTPAASEGTLVAPPPAEG